VCSKVVLLHFVAKSLLLSKRIPYIAAMEIRSVEHMSTQVRDFHDWFQREYLKRRKKNGNYSVRAFANYLKLASGTVSHLLSGKRKPSAKFVSRLFARLDVTLKEQELILRSLKKNNKATNIKHNKYEMIALDAFKLMSDWFHYAILELTSVKDFKYDYSWIANQLGISVTETRQAVERLLRLDLVVELNGTLTKTHGFVTNAEDGVTSSALKKLQRHVLQKALDAIDTVAIEEKDITSMTMAIDEKKLPEARKRVERFRRELCAFLEDGEQTRVFNLGVQLYPVSKGTRK
jgi:uncharacterized protein (TIGR02147 family)